jgi:hypothetical protein
MLNVLSTFSYGRAFEEHLIEDELRERIAHGHPPSHDPGKSSDLGSPPPIVIRTSVSVFTESERHGLGGAMGLEDQCCLRCLLSAFSIT